MISDADLYIGHGFKFEIRDEKNAVICNKVCLAKSKRKLLKKNRF